MFGAIFFPTTPHTWAPAMRFKDDYERAGVPMLTELSRRILAYTVGMVLISLSLLFVGLTVDSVLGLPVPL